MLEPSGRTKGPLLRYVRGLSIFGQLIRDVVLRFPHGRMMVGTSVGRAVNYEPQDGWFSSQFLLATCQDVFGQDTETSQ